MLSTAHPPARLAWSVWGVAALLYLFAFYQRVAPAVMTDRLMAEFAITGAALGNLSAFYFYAYVAMQIPTGILADRWGPRRLLTAGAAVSAVGTLLFAFAPTLFWAGAGRLLVGASVAVAFVTALKLSSHWLPPQRYALASGLALLMGVVGGVFAGVPLRLLVESFDWRPVMAVSAILAMALAALAWVWVRDDPAERGYAGYFSGGDHRRGEGIPVLHGIARVFAYRNTWLLMLAPIGFSGAVLTFGGLWGVPYLRQMHGLDPKSAAAITSTMLVAWAVGGPVLGAWSERIGRRKPLYFVSGLVACAGWAAVAYLPLELGTLTAILVVTGFASGNIIIGFAWAKESVPMQLVGTASGVCNMGPLLGGVFLQPGVGWMLDRYWQGIAEGGVRSYGAEAWQAGFGLMLATVCAAAVAIVFARESRCRGMA